MNNSTSSLLSSRFLSNANAVSDVDDLSFSLCHGYWHLYSC